MRGTILGFDIDTNIGAIVGHDGNRYEFVRLEWRSAATPANGVLVDFVPENGHATQIYPASPVYDPAEGSAAQIVYILYLVSLAVGVTAIVGLIIAYVNKSTAPEWVQTHYRLQIRTFWIGLLYCAIGFVTMFIIIGFLIFAFVFVWWIVRCVKGLKFQATGLPYDKPASWLW